jgi:hypothetical protein
MGVVFRCGAAAAFFRERMDTIANAHVDLDDLVGPRSRGLRERLLDPSDAPSSTPCAAARRSNEAASQPIAASTISRTSCASSASSPA